jgi:hypothetical protein
VYLTVRKLLNRYRRSSRVNTWRDLRLSEASMLNQSRTLTEVTCPNRSWWMRLPNLGCLTKTCVASSSLKVWCNTEFKTWVEVSTDPPSFSPNPYFRVMNNLSFRLERVQPPLLKSMSLCTQWKEITYRTTSRIKLNPNGLMCSRICLSIKAFPENIWKKLWLMALANKLPSWKQSNTRKTRKMLIK